MKTIYATNGEVQEGYIGACLACGIKVDGVEPDTFDGKCPSCHNFSVYGLERLFNIGLLIIK